MIASPSTSTTHDTGGITQKDVDLAYLLERLALS